MNTVDAIVIGAIAISALVAFLRGFVREMLTMGSWIGAAIVAIYGFPAVQPKFEQWISNKLGADIAGVLALFLGSLILFSILSHMIARLVRGSALTAVDRSLGLLFGLIRGAILVSLAYMLVIWMDPALLLGARTAPAMARGAEILRSWAPPQLANQLPADLRPPQPDRGAKSDPVQTPAYNQRQNDALQRLIDATSKK
jgi:membrane protein required for colicin V production